MRVATRLRSAFAIYIALLAAVLVYHVRTIQQAVTSSHELTEISSRLRISSTSQLTRVEQMSSDAEKYLVTLDTGYLLRFDESRRAYAAGLRGLDSISLGAPEEFARGALRSDWREVEAQAQQLAMVGTVKPDAARAIVARLQESLEKVRGDTRKMALASDDAMTREVARSEESARAAEKLSWVAAIGALLLSLALSALLVRSIVDPLGRLAEGTREVSAGRFDYRLDTRHTDEFAQVARDFNSMTERLDELDKMKRDFVAKVSHDLKTPLSSMQETISVMLDGLPGPLTDKQRYLLSLNLDSGQRLSAMLSKLLDLSRIEGGLAPDFQMLDVSQVVIRSLDRVGAAAGTAGVTVDFAKPEGRLLLRGDDLGVGQVLDNLVENAIKFSPPGGTVRIRAAEWVASDGTVPAGLAVRVQRSGLGGGAVLFTVADEGAGIPDDEKERVFAQFYQSDTGRGVRSRGVGLGLAICKEIVDAHGGAIWVADNEPRGSVFSVLLPGAVPAPELAGTTAEAAS